MLPLSGSGHLRSPEWQICPIKLAFELEMLLQIRGRKACDGVLLVGEALGQLILWNFGLARGSSAHHTDGLNLRGKVVVRLLLERRLHGEVMLGYRMLRVLLRPCRQAESRRWELRGRCGRGSLALTGWHLGLPLVLGYRGVRGSLRASLCLCLCSGLGLSMCLLLAFGGTGEPVVGRANGAVKTCAAYHHSRLRPVFPALMHILTTSLVFISQSSIDTRSSLFAHFLR